jgi:hypothetical protein
MDYKTLKLYTELSEEKKAEIDKIVGEIIDLRVQINEAKARGDDTAVKAASSEGNLKLNQIWRILRPVEYRKDNAFPTPDAKKAAFKKDMDPFSNVGKAAGDKKYEEKKAAEAKIAGPSVGTMATANATNAAALRSGPRGTPNGVFAPSVSNIEKDITTMMAMDPKGITRNIAIGMLSEEQRAILASVTPTAAPTAAANAAALRSGPRGGPPRRGGPGGPGGPPRRGGPGGPGGPPRRGPGGPGGPPPPPPAPAIRGVCLLRNGYNVCYMNSVLQVLYTIPELRNFLINLTDAQIARAISLCGDFSDDRLRGLLPALRTLFTQMRTSIATNTPMAVHPLRQLGQPVPAEGTVYTRILDAIEPLQVQFPRGGQGDANELIEKLLFQSLFCADIAQDLQTLFNLSIRQTYTCKDPSINPPPRTDSLKVISFPVQDVQSIQDAIDCYEASTKICDDNMVVQCRPANSAENALGRGLTQQYKILVPNTTKYIFLQAIRVQYNRYALRDPAYYVDRPVELTNIITIDGKHFKLKMAICKFGLQQGGHYIAYNFGENGNPIYEFDDDRVRPYNDPGTLFSQWGPGSLYSTKNARAGELIKQTAYVLMYEKIEGMNLALSTGPIGLFGNQSNFEGGRRRRKTHKRRQSKKKSTRRH